MTVKIEGTIIAENGKRFTVAVENKDYTEYIHCVVEDDRLLTLINLDRRNNRPFSFRKGAKVFVLGSMKTVETVLFTSFTGATRKVYTSYLSPDRICVKDTTGRPRNLIQA